MIVYLDFDGTVVEHDYPRIGRANFGCIEVIKKLQDAGHEIILNTYRSDCKNGTLEKALDFLNDDYWMILKDKSNTDLELKPITKFTKRKINPPAWDWFYIKQTKIMYIDDISFGIPLKKAVYVQNRMVDWDALDKQFIENNIY